jgi:hypothetical protein
MQKEKLAVIVPYRNRKSHLRRFAPHLNKFLDKKGIPHKIFVVEQGDKKPFNRGKLLNIGYKIARDEGYDYFAFHDVDMLPEKADYSYVEKPVHLAKKLSDNNYELIYIDYFGGVVLFNKDDFEFINGYSNEYWGWGFEDDDLLYRCKIKGLKLDKKWVGDKRQTIDGYFQFNGKRDYIEIPISKSLKDIFTKSFSISVRAKPEFVTSNKKQESDEYFIISRPGHNTGISYNSFKRYKTDLFLSNYDSVSVSSDIIGEHWTYLTMTVDLENYILNFFKDGKFVNNVKFYDPIFDYNNDSFYLGVGNLKNTGSEYFFKGFISEVCIWDTEIEEDEIFSLYKKSIVDKPTMSSYRSSKNLKCYYDFSHFFKNEDNEYLLDCSGNNNHGIIHGTISKSATVRFGSYIDIPSRRSGKYTCLGHSNNSWEGHKWVHGETRKNQIKFFNEVRDNDTCSDGINIDGLNTLRFKVVEKKSYNSYDKLKVNL